ncbi:winged helix-turn-helix transcriptional regulator [Aureibacter tunicatorum]|uniref:DNA-binding HxlR family transcriptional regulator n=1 Tax=Aureibacter tunicatorum TaxID=866807 RepID=A0AAE3XKW4_9BACT|nr:helix-turn-helix domain-containing protein [Aureibacter tunicatorum]MDR6238757.1 DNA-binding HxlR family transcriptional regulator [Aureibacter tunicatorum]BDD05312.1 transcriptional regulator [Aureibacter tunicatorum]
MLNTEKNKSYCPLAHALELIGGKWKCLILFHLIEGPKRSGSLQKDVHGLSNKVFSETVRSLEKNDLISRTVYPTVPPKVEYKLTDLGISLIPILKALDDWGKKLDARTSSNL